MLSRWLELHRARLMNEVRSPDQLEKLGAIEQHSHWSFIYQ